MHLNQRKAISLLVSLVYFTTQVALASATESNIWTERRKHQSTQLAALPSPLINQLPTISASLPVVAEWRSKAKTSSRISKRFQGLIDSIPLIYGSIQDVYDSGNNKTSPVVLVQDIHLNTEAQTNIASILQEMIDQKQIGLVGVEGAFAAFDFAPFRQYQNKEITRAVVQDFLDKNLLAAPSFVGITSAVEPPPFIGVDDRTHYDANLEALYASRDQKNRVTKQVAHLKQELIETKRKTFSKELAGFDNLRAAYHKGDLGFGAYVKKLAALTGENDFVIDQFLEAYAMESSLDFKRVEHERRSVIEKLTQRLDEKEVHHLVAQSLAYRMGRIGFGDYYQGLKDLCEKKGISLSRTPHFDNYIRYVLLSDGIKAEALFKSVEKLEETVTSQLAKTENQKKLVAESEYISLVEKLTDFSLTPREWEKYRAVMPARADIKALNLKPFENFYKEADIRSHKMVGNLRGKKDEGQGMVLVVGGFHSPQIAELMRQEKISYVVVSPKLTKIDEKSGSSYLSVFAREKTPLDRLFAGEKLFVYPEAVAVTHPQTAAITDGALETNQFRRTVTRTNGDKTYRSQYDPEGTQKGLHIKDATITEGKPNKFSQMNVFQVPHDWLAQKIPVLQGWSKILLQTLWILTHPLTSSITETFGLWGAVSLVDPSGLTLIGIAIIFSLIHTDLWDHSIGWDEFANRLIQRLVGGLILTTPIMFIPGLSGLLLSGFIHLLWNAVSLEAKHHGRKLELNISGEGFMWTVIFLIQLWVSGYALHQNYENWTKNQNVNTVSAPEHPGQAIQNDSRPQSEKNPESIDRNVNNAETNKAQQLVDPKITPIAKDAPASRKTLDQVKDYSSDFVLESPERGGASGLQPYGWDASDETAVGKVDGEVFGPLFNGIYFNFQSDGSLATPQDLGIVPQGNPTGRSARFSFRVQANGVADFRPLVHLRGVIQKKDISIFPIDNTGKRIGSDILFEFKDGQIILEHHGRIQIEIRIINYDKNVDFQYSARSLPENEIMDFPDQFAREIIQTVLDSLSGRSALRSKLMGMSSFREKLDAIAQSSEVLSAVKIEATANVLNLYTAYNGSYAMWEHNGRSHGSTWSEILESNSRIRIVCGNSATMYALIAQRLGLRSAYMPIQNYTRKGDFLIHDSIPHAIALVKTESSWRPVETTKLMPFEDGLIAGSGGAKFIDPGTTSMLGVDWLDVKPTNGPQKIEDSPQVENRSQRTSAPSLVETHQNIETDGSIPFIAVVLSALGFGFLFKWLLTKREAFPHIVFAIKNLISNDINRQLLLIINHKDIRFIPPIPDEYVKGLNDEQLQVFVNTGTGKLREAAKKEMQRRADEKGADFGIASDNSSGVTRNQHEAFHEQGKFDEIIGNIASEIGAIRKSNGDLDLRGVTEKAGGRLSTVHGELRIESDGILVIIDRRFQKDHAGRGRFAVFARSEVKAAHEMAELRAWAEFARKNGIATLKQIKEGQLGHLIRVWINGKDENLSLTSRKNRLAEVKQLAEKFHQIGLIAEDKARSSGQQKLKSALEILQSSTRDTLLRIKALDDVIVLVNNDVVDAGNSQKVVNAVLQTFTLASPAVRKKAQEALVAILNNEETLKRVGSNEVIKYLVPLDNQSGDIFDPFFDEKTLFSKQPARLLVIIGSLLERFQELLDKENLSDEDAVDLKKLIEQQTADPINFLNPSFLIGLVSIGNSERIEQLDAMIVFNALESLATALLAESGEKITRIALALVKRRVAQIQDPQDFIRSMGELTRTLRRANEAIVDEKLGPFGFDTDDASKVILAGTHGNPYALGELDVESNSERLLENIAGEADFIIASEGENSRPLKGSNFSKKKPVDETVQAKSKGTLLNYLRLSIQMGRRYISISDVTDEYMWLERLRIMSGDIPETGKYYRYLRDNDVVRSEFLRLHNTVLKEAEKTLKEKSITWKEEPSLMLSILEKTESPFIIPDELIGFNVLGNSAGNRDWDSTVRNGWHEGSPFGDLLEGKRLLVMGDTHHDFLGIQRGLVNHLSELKAAGVTHLALEVSRNNTPPSFAANESLPDWLQGVRIPHRFLELLEKAYELGLEIVFIDLPEAERQSMVSWQDEGSQRRGIAMGRFMADFLQDHPQSKMAAVVGYSHIFNFEEIPLQLQDREISHSLVALVGTDQPDRKHGERVAVTSTLEVVRAINEVTNGQKQYGYVELDDNQAGVDVIVHFEHSAEESLSPQRSEILALPSEGSAPSGEIALAGGNQLALKSIEIPYHAESFINEVDPWAYTWTDTNEAKIMEFTSGVKGLSNSQRLYLAVLLFGFSGNEKVNSSGSILRIEFIPMRKIFKVTTVDTFSRPYDPDQDYGPSMRTFEIDLGRLLATYGFDDLQMKDLRDVPQVDIQNNPERLLSIPKFFVLVLTVLNGHAERIVVSGDSLKIFRGDARLPYSGQIPHIVEMHVNDFELSQFEKLLFEARNEASSLMNFLVALEGSWSLTHHQRNTALILGLKDRRVRTAHDSLRKAWSSLNHFKNDFLHHPILEARKELRFLKREEVADMLDKLSVAMKDLNEALDITENLFKKYPDLSEGYVSIPAHEGDRPGQHEGQKPGDVPAIIRSVALTLIKIDYDLNDPSGDVLALPGTSKFLTGTSVQKEQSRNNAISKPGSILDPMLRWLRSYSWGKPLYWIVTVIGASIWETYVFQNHGFANLVKYFVEIGLDSSLSAVLGIAGIGMAFAFAHTIITWLARVKKDGWRNAFTAEALQGDARDFGARAGLSVGFTIPFLFLDPITAFIVTIIAHSLYNAAKLAGLLPSNAPIASIFDKHMIDTGKQTPAKEIASKLVSLITTPHDDRKALADAIFNLVDAEKVFDEGLKQESSRTAQWRDVAKALNSELAQLAGSGDFPSEEARARLADLTFILRSVLTKSELETFIGSLGAISSEPKFKDARGFAVWVDSAEQAKSVLQESRGRPVILGMTEANRAKILAEVGQNMPVVIGHDKMTALDFINAAQELPMFKGQQTILLNLLVMDGVALPASFFDLSPRETEELRRQAFIFFVTKTLQAVEVDVSLLPEWDVIRTRLIQA